MWYSELPITNEDSMANIAPPTLGHPIPTVRMDLVVTNSDFSTTLADVTITHPFPSSNLTITPTMTNPGYFARYREKLNKENTLLAPLL